MWNTRSEPAEPMAVIAISGSRYGAAISIRKSIGLMKQALIERLAVVE